MTDTESDVHRSSVTYPRAFVRRVASVTRARPAGGPVTEADLDGLPAAAVRYLRFMNVVGKARTGSLLAAAHGRFRMRPNGRWMACRTWQLSTAVPVRRLFHMHLRVAPGIAMTAWDTYADGSGHMRGKLFGALPVASGTGPHFTTSELVTWLNDAVLLAPSMLLGPACKFARTGMTTGSASSSPTAAARSRRGCWSTRTAPPATSGPTTATRTFPVAWSGAGRARRSRAGPSSPGDPCPLAPRRCGS